MKGTALTGEMDRANSAFWNRLSGTSLAESIGAVDLSSESLARFDQRYFEQYPYLSKYLNFGSLKGKKVMEVGLGYGSLGQKMAEAGADYLGIDVAPLPVQLLNHRLRLHGLRGGAVQGSMLHCPIRTETQDYVVAIGCFHHTGDVQRCLDEAFRVLKEGGMAVVMVYNLFSYRQWHRWPVHTLAAWCRGWTSSDVVLPATEKQKLAYDGADPSGKGAPTTVFLSIRQLRRMLGRFSQVSFAKENCNDFCWSTDFRFPRHGRLVNHGRMNFQMDVYLPRRALLPWLGRRLGLDIYITARK